MTRARDVLDRGEARRGEATPRSLCSCGRDTRLLCEPGLELHHQVEVALSPEFAAHEGRDAIDLAAQDAQPVVGVGRDRNTGILGGTLVVLKLAIVNAGRPGARLAA